MTADECQVKCDVKGEKQLQIDIGQLLNQRGIVFISPVFGKKTRIKVGWPDFTFSYFGQTCCIEAKRPGFKPTAEQAKVIQSLRASPNYARVLVATSLEQVKEFLNAVLNQKEGPLERFLQTPSIGGRVE